MNAPLPAARPGGGVSRAWLKALETTARATRDPARILPRAVDEWAEAYGDAPALFSARECLNFNALARRKARYARWAIASGLHPGDAVALIMRNRPDYFALWLGLTEAGVIAALVSPDLAAPALTHALKVSLTRLAIVDNDLVSNARDAIARLESPCELWVHEGEADARSLEAALKSCDAAPLGAAERPPVTLDDRALRIFTSGTTGLPKAAEVSHRRLITWTHWFAALAGFDAHDRHYNCLPMHHSVGGVVAIGAPLVNGGSVVVCEKFSARKFFDDVAHYECTAFQYIGELCRYLIAQPASAAEKTSKLRLALGNGLSGDVWRKMLARFGEMRVLEFYASTEGNVWLYNVEGRIGSIGRIPPYLAPRDPIALARFEAERQAPWRGPDGFCTRAEEGEIGEALGRIGDAQAFEGYSEPAESEKKVLRDVFKKGDAWMRTGDLMRRDADGFYYFVDRIGDTFRWKGENVATLEVAGACKAQAGVEDALVYGVAVPGAEGRAGMALLKTSALLDLEAFARGMEVLPRYARPLFLRITDAIETTETHKPKRGVYVAEGFDPARSRDPLYVYDAEREAYVNLDAERHEAIVKGEMRL